MLQDPQKKKKDSSKNSRDVGDNSMKNSYKRGYEHT